MKLMLYLLAIFSIKVGAQSVVPEKPDWSGYLGAGLVTLPKYSGGSASTTVLLPLPQFEYKGTVYVDLLRVGARFWTSADQKLAIGLAGEPRFGFRSNDGPRLVNMATRRTSFEAGPSLEWETPYASLNLAWFSDTSSASKGQSLRLGIYKQFVDNDQWDIGGTLGLEHLDSKIVNYYFGVPAPEVSGSRTQYSAGGTTNPSFGISGAYKLNKRNSLMFGFNTLYLGKAAWSSPIVEQRRVTYTYFGYAWNLQ